MFTKILNFKIVSKKKLTESVRFDFFFVVDKFLREHLEPIGKYVEHCSNSVKIMNDGNAKFVFPSVKFEENISTKNISTESTFFKFLESSEEIKKFLDGEEFIIEKVTKKILEIRVITPMVFNRDSIEEYGNIVLKNVIAEFNWKCNYSFKTLFERDNAILEFDTVEITFKEQQEFVFKLQNNKWIKAFFGDTPFTLI